MILGNYFNPQTRIGLIILNLKIGGNCEFYEKKLGKLCIVAVRQPTDLSFNVFVSIFPVFINVNHIWLLTPQLNNSSGGAIILVF